MSRNQPTRAINPVRTLQKFVVSTFVVCTFIAYAVHEHLVSSTALSAAAPPPNATPTLQVAPTDSPLVLGTPQPGDAPQTIPTATPPPLPTAVPQLPTAAPTALANGLYKNGAYTGPEVDAYWGLVQVKAVVQNGKLTSVQFLEYPSDRRTSQRINNVAMPYLQQEAIQAQSANVDIISGATLTSEAFAQSLQIALSSAKP
jgi:uncharacterized protein with FMN-binding domain